MKASELEKKLNEAGWFFHRYAKGSHQIWRNNNGGQIVIAPHKGKEVGTGLANKILKQAGAK